jgi:hypothetical protein
LNKLKIVSGKVAKKEALNAREYSYSKGIRNGINIADCTDKVVVVPPVVPPTIPEPPVVPEKPISDTDKEQNERIGKLETAVKALQELVNKIIEWITSFKKG